MLNDPVQREIAKATGTGLAAIAGGPLAAALAATLGVAVELLGYLGEKRTQELFETEEFLNKVVAEIEKSDDFAGFVYDVWMRHNFESSEVRRKRLKAILKNATSATDRDFENFTRIITAAQQISSKGLKVLAAFYGDTAYTFSANPKPDKQSFILNPQQVDNLMKSLGMEEGTQNIRTMLNQLSYLGLLGSYVAMDGEYYMPIGFGKIFLEYVRE